MNIEFTIDIPRGYSPEDREHMIEVPLNRRLKENDLGCVVGGGSWIDGSGCDVSVVVSDAGRGLVEIRKVLRAVRVPRRTIIRQHGPGTTEHAVYPRPLWQLLRRFRRSSPERWTRVTIGDVFRLPNECDEDPPFVKVLRESELYPDFIVVGIYLPDWQQVGFLVTVQPINAARWVPFPAREVDEEDLKDIPENLLESLEGVKISFHGAVESQAWEMARSNRNA